MPSSPVYSHSLNVQSDSEPDSVLIDIFHGSFRRHAVSSALVNGNESALDIEVSSEFLYFAV